MERNTTRSYIEKRIKNARTPLADDIAVSNIVRWGRVPADSARRDAQLGFEDTTASHLHLATNLTISQKGAILAEAYTKKTDQLTREIFLQRVLRVPVKHKDKRDAQTSHRYAYYLRLAANKAQDS